MVGGQVDDLAWESNPDKAHSFSELEALHARKTGALICVSLRLGAWVAQGHQPNGPDLELLEHLTTYGRCLGLAFQITDDLLDVEGNPQQMGKQAQKDAGRGKLTYPGILGVEESRQKAEQLCRQAESSVAHLGAAGERLGQLAQFVLKRDR